MKHGKWNVTFEQGYVGTRGLHAARTKGRQKWKTLPSERWRRFVSAVRPISLPFYRSPVNTAPLSISNVTASSLLLRLLHNARIYHESLDGTSPSFVYGCSFSVNIRQERGPFCHSFLLCQTRFLNRWYINDSIRFNGKEEYLWFFFSIENKYSAGEGTILSFFPSFCLIGMRNFV